MDTATLFTIIIIIIAVILVAVGIYLLLVLHEARNSLKKTNRILDHLESVANVIDTKIARPAGSISGILVALKEGLELVSSFRKNNSQEGQNERY